MDFQSFQGESLRVKRPSLRVLKKETGGSESSLEPVPTPMEIEFYYKVVPDPRDQTGVQQCIIRTVA